jgi:hypothetical protein
MTTGEPYLTVGPTTGALHLGVVDDYWAGSGDDGRRSTCG